MNYSQITEVRLLSRNEGRIKSYASCLDLRAWSHDSNIRCRYLRDWIKADMPVCVIHPRTLACFMNIMVRRDRSRVPPRCHPDCKSKVLLESICTSCNAITECIKKDGNYQKYFEEEEFETSHWPCERCMDALKAIKMFWKIMLQKVFHVDLPKSNIEAKNSEKHDSPKLIAQHWQSQIIEQAIYLKQTIPGTSIAHGYNCKSWEETQNPCNSNNLPRNVANNDGFNRSYVISSKAKSIQVNNNDATHSLQRSEKSYKTNNKCTCVKVRKTDVASSANVDGEDDVTLYKVKLEKMRKMCNKQTTEVERLSRENYSLRQELSSVYQSCTWKASYHPVNNEKYSVSLVPRCETSAEMSNDDDANHEIDSETIITMKNCKHKDYHHVTLLQVLHKTNKPTDIEKKLNEASNIEKQNPVDVLAKVRETFGSILRREMVVLKSEGRPSTRRSHIHATSQNLGSSRSAPSCATISSALTGYVSARDNSEE